MNVVGDLAGVTGTLKMRLTTMVPASHTAKWEAIHCMETLSGQVEKGMQRFAASLSSI